MSISLKNKKALITGANGFIGSHVVQRLLKEGAQVSILVREESDLWRIEEFIREIRVFKADLRDRDRIYSYINELKPDYVFHMAAYGVDSRQKNYLTAVNTNVIGTMNLLTPLITLGCEKFLNIGTCMEYGDKNSIFTEKDYLEPFNIYGSTKASATLLAHQVAAENDIDIATLRLFGLFGEKEDKNRLFPHIILSILKKADVALTGCEQYRDYTYIANVIDGIILAAINKEVKNEIFNMGSGEVRQLKELVTTIFEQMNSKQQPMFGAVPYRERDFIKPHADISKIKQSLNWLPKITIEDGLANTIKWYRENVEKYK